jgi:hypothetical protein
MVKICLGQDVACDQHLVDDAAPIRQRCVGEGLPDRDRTLRGARQPRNGVGPGFRKPFGPIRNPPVVQ